MLPEISVLVWATVTKIPRLNGLNKIYLFLSFKDGSFKFQFQGWKFKMLVDLVSGEGPLPVLQKPNFLLRRRQWHPTPVLLPGKSMDRGAWWAAVHGVVESRARLSNFTVTFHFHALEKEMATHSSALAWRVPGTGEPGGL